MLSIAKYIMSEVIYIDLLCEILVEKKIVSYIKHTSFNIRKGLKCELYSYFKTDKVSVKFLYILFLKPFG